MLDHINKTKQKSHTRICLICTQTTQSTWTIVNMGERDYIVIVDRVTGYIKPEQTPNQGTDAAIPVIKNWGLLFGYPMRVISDAGGGFRKDFKKKLKILNIRHKHSSAYHPQSNSLAERAVGSLKNTLKKSPKYILKIDLKEIIFQINLNIS